MSADLNPIDFASSDFISRKMRAAQVHLLMFIHLTHRQPSASKPRASGGAQRRQAAGPKGRRGTFLEKTKHVRDSGSQPRRVNQVNNVGSLLDLVPATGWHGPDLRTL